MKRSQRRAPKLTSWDRLILGFCTLLVSPKRLSKDPLFRFQRWLANLRILEIDEIKSVPGTPRSHAFIERLIGTIRREYLDQTLFWNQGDLERKLDRYKVYYNRHRCHTGLAGITPPQRSGAPEHQKSQACNHTAGENTATASFRPRRLLELCFARTGDRGRPWHECAGLKPARTHHRGCESGDAAPRPTGRPRSLDQQSTPPLDCWSQRS